MGSPSRTSNTGNMFSIKLGLFVCILFVIDMEAAPEQKPEDLHIHINLHDPTGAAKEDNRKAMVSSRYLLLETEDGADEYSVFNDNSNEDQKAVVKKNDYCAIDYYKRRMRMK